MRKYLRGLATSVAVTTLAATALSGCGAKNDGALSLTLLYRDKSVGGTKVAQVVKQELEQIGVHVNLLAASNADFYTKYLQSKDAAKNGTFDIAIAGWGPDWYGDGAASFFSPLFDGRTMPPNSSNFGWYNSDATNKLIDQASAAATQAESNALWAQADRQVMQDAAIFPITDPLTANYHSPNIHNAVVVPQLQEIDPLTVTKTGTDASTLHLLGTGDVDYLDPSVTYYSSGYEAARFYSRQLFSYPAVEGHATEAYADIATEVPTKANGGVSADGKTVTVHMRSGVMWNTSPARAVTAQDVVRGVQRSCNPVQPFGGLPDYQNLLEGFADWCTKFAEDAGKTPTVDSIKKAMEAPFTAVTAPDANTVVYHLTHPASYFPSMLTLPALSAPVPVEYLNYLPASAELAQHQLSNGPYKIESYTPTKSIIFTPNPVWSQATDPIRKQNFTKVIVSETGDQSAIQQQLQAGSPSADLEWDTFPPPTSVPALYGKDPKLTLTPSSSSNPYVVFNTVSPNNNGAMGNAAVRRALSEALDRAALLKVLGGDLQNKSLSHILPSAIFGSKDFDLYPFDPTKAKADLDAALHPTANASATQ